MANKYSYKELDISDFILDDENPRFASSVLVEGSNTKVSQTTIIAHLVRHADIIKLAKRIDKVHELHGSELITCYERDGKYVVLEGNRRICACKLLLNRDLIPEEYKNIFPFISDETKKNIENIQTCVYPDRDSVQAYLSDRHISGVKKWSALEKNNYYMNLFQKHGTLTEVKDHTSDSESTIKSCITKYQFFMDVFDVLKKGHSDIEIEKLDYLPMVDRFMNILVGEDEEVGLHLCFNDNLLKYSANPPKIEIYEKILSLIGEAFLLRPEKKNCAEGELSKIISTEIKNYSDQKALIINNDRIPGLIALIKNYRHNESAASVLDTSDTCDNRDGASRSVCQDCETGAGDILEINDNNENSINDGDGEKTFIPPAKFRPKKCNKECLCFSYDEGKRLKIRGTSDYEGKINEIIRDLATLSVYEHPYACAMLYRTLLEITTRLIYERFSATIGHSYNDDNNLVSNMKTLNNNFLFKGQTGGSITKIRGQIKTRLTSENIIDTLNLYIHYANPVDVQTILSSWNTMKFYLIACLEK